MRRYPRFAQILRWQRISPFVVGCGVGLLGVFIVFKDLVLRGALDVLWANDFDPRLIYWIVNWGYHVIFEQGRPLSFWNANSFYPHQFTLAYSDSLLSLQIFFAPLRALGVSPLASLYGALAGVCLVGTTLTVYALRRTGYFSLAESALIGFSAHFGLSFTSYLYHYQLFGFHLAPSFFLFLYLYLQRLRFIDLAFLLSTFAIGVCFATYLAPMLLILSIILAIPIIARQIKCIGIKQLFRKIGIKQILVIACCAAVLYFVQFRPYFKVARDFPRQSAEETAVYSANVDSILTGYSKFSFWYSPEEYSVYGEWEYAYFPGFILLSSLPLYTLASLVRVITARTERTLLRVKESVIEPDFVLYMAILFFASLVLSWGPFYKSDHSIKFPFYYLSRIVPGLDKVRAPGRFGIFFGLPLAVFLAAFLHLLTANRSRRKFLTSLALALIVIESLPKFPLFPFIVDSRGVYKQVSQQVPEGTPLLELPVLGKDNFETIKIAMEQLNGSTLHWCKLVVGYGADMITPEYREMLYLDGLVQEGRSDPVAMIEFAQKYGIAHLLVHTTRYELPIRKQWRARLHEVGATILMDEEGVILARLEGAPRGKEKGAQ